MTWRKTVIGEFVEKGDASIQTGPFGTQLKASDYVSDGVPVINVRNIGHGSLRQSDLEYVTETTSDRLAVHILAHDDIVFGRKGAVDRHLLVQNGQAGWMQGSDCIRLRFQTPDVDARFVSYCFLSPTHQQWMLNQSSNKATMASLNQDIIKRIPISIPSPDVQRDVVDVVSKYDDLIENNTRRINLLEDAARMLYEEWFVRLRFPGHEHTPIDDGVPEGWRTVALSELATVNRESLTSRHSGEVEYIDISSVSPGRINHTTTYNFRDAPSRARRVVQHGDIIWSCVRPNRRSYAVIWQPPSNLIASTGFAVLTPTEGTTAFLVHATTTDAFVGYLNNNARGAAYPAVRASDFERAVVLCPTRTLLDMFTEFVEPMLAQAHLLSAQTSRLREARDLLLPRLMSGEVAV